MYIFEPVFLFVHNIPHVLGKKKTNNLKSICDLKVNDQRTYQLVAIPDTLVSGSEAAPLLKKTVPGEEKVSAVRNKDTRIIRDKAHPQ